MPIASSRSIQIWLPHRLPVWSDQKPDIPFAEAAYSENNGNRHDAAAGNTQPFWMRPPSLAPTNTANARNRISAATAVAIEGGIAGRTFGKVGERHGISDRTVAYYFPTKAALVTAVVQARGAELAGLLDQAFGSKPRSQAELLKRAWPARTTPAADRVFAL